MKKVVVESPYSGDRRRNISYARACLNDCFRRGEAPFASHLLYTQHGVLDDDIPSERELGMQAGFAWSESADITAVYTDLGISAGMVDGIRNAVDNERPVELRMLGGDWEL